MHPCADNCYEYLKPFEMVLTDSLLTSVVGNAWKIGFVSILHRMSVRTVQNIDTFEHTGNII